MTALLDELPDAMVPEAPFLLPAPHPADAIPPVQRVLDASAAVLPDEAEGATAPAQAAELFAEKLVALALVVPVPDAMCPPRALPEAATAPYTRDAGQSAA